MTRQSISFTSPNDQWLKDQVESKEYTSKSDVINDLIRKTRQQKQYVEHINAKLLAAENSVKKSGWVQKSPEQMLEGFKEKARSSGKL